MRIYELPHPHPIQDKNFKSRSRFFGILVLSLRLPSYEATATRHPEPNQGRAASRNTTRFMQTASRHNQAQPLFTKGSGSDAADLQLSPEYAYQSGNHTDSFFLSAGLAMSLADAWNRGP